MLRTSAGPPSEQKAMCRWKEEIFKIGNISTNVLYNEFGRKRTTRLELSLE